ncbi:MAG: hypothetical protein WC699_12200 [Bacteroidales bacterium]|jgi:hypothetical protein
MKTKYLLALFSLLAVNSCDREGSVTPTINRLSGSVCKGNGLKAATDQSSDKDCIQYSWESGDSLAIKHVNAAFNCCPEGFRADVKVEGDTIIITENENSALCDCNCLYDLTYKISGIDKKTWWIRVEEPYINGSDQEKILFRAELRKNADGEFCLTRKSYPWGL